MLKKISILIFLLVFGCKEKVFKKYESISFTFEESYWENIDKTSFENKFQENFNRVLNSDFEDLVEEFKKSKPIIEYSENGNIEKVKVKILDFDEKKKERLLLFHREIHKYNQGQIFVDYEVGRLRDLKEQYSKCEVNKDCKSFTINEKIFDGILVVNKIVADSVGKIFKESIVDLQGKESDKIKVECVKSQCVVIEEE